MPKEFHQWAKWICSVSYTHLDVYKRQGVQGREHPVVFTLFQGITQQGIGKIRLILGIGPILQQAVGVFILQLTIPEGVRQGLAQNFASIGGAAAQVPGLVIAFQNSLFRGSTQENQGSAGLGKMCIRDSTITTRRGAMSSTACRVAPSQPLRGGSRTMMSGRRPSLARRAAARPASSQ